MKNQILIEFLLSLVTRTVTFGSETQPIITLIHRCMNDELDLLSGYWMRECKLFGVQV